MNREQAQAFSDRWVDAWNSHDVDAIVALYMTDAVNRDMGRDMALMGREAIREFFSTYLESFADIALKVSRVGVDGDTVYVQWHSTGTQHEPYHGIAPSGQAFETDGCIVFDLAPDGLIRSEINYWDVASLLRQLGVMPAWPAEGAVAQ